MATRASYDQLKEFGGKRYTGMRVGRSHTWRYEAGEWKERKVTPDRWEFRYAVVKRRAGRAPEGSGAPVGTAYDWYIVADQVVTKLDANSYMTEMVGHKLKVAHKRANRESWSASERTKRKHLVALLRELADDLESRPVEEPPAAEAATDGATNGRTRSPRAARPHAAKSSRAPRATRRQHAKTSTPRRRTASTPHRARSTKHARAAARRETPR